MKEILDNKVTCTCGTLQAADAGLQNLCSSVVKKEEWTRGNVEVLLSEGVLWPKKIKIGYQGRDVNKQRKEGFLTREAILCAGMPVSLSLMELENKDANVNRPQSG